jgi:hypothetical protein
MPDAECHWNSHIRSRLLIRDVTNEIIRSFVDFTMATFTTMTTMRGFWICVLCLLLQSNVVVTLITPNPLSNFRSASVSVMSLPVSRSKDPEEGHPEEDRPLASVGVGIGIDRRQVCSVLGCLGSGMLLAPRSAQAAESTKSQLKQPLANRVTGNLLTSPDYGIEGADVFYPAWFSGTWSVDSVCTEVQAPCGVVLFGGNRTYDKAQKEIGTSLLYESRFVTSTANAAAGEQETTTTTSNLVTADREYNVKSIAKAAMGANSVVDVNLATPNKFSCVLAPKGSPSLLRVDLITLNRRQETISDTVFHCSEVVREIVAPVGPQAAGTTAVSTNPILKEVETTSLYTYYDPKSVKPGDPLVRCRQRSATFILPSQENDVQMYLFSAAKGRPVDVRFYDVAYTKR